MRGLKFLVGIMTLMIVICAILLVFGLTRQAGHVSASMSQPRAPLHLPKNARVLHMAGDGDHLALYVTVDGAEYIYPYDLSENKPGERITVQRE